MCAYWQKKEAQNRISKYSLNDVHFMSLIRATENDMAVLLG